MALTKCKAKPKFKWTKRCVMSAAGNDNDDDNSDNFTIDAKLHVLFVTLSRKGDQKLSKLLSK